ncbi:hypothetical protein [Halocola ammonii]
MLRISILFLSLLVLSNFSNAQNPSQSNFKKWSDWQTETVSSSDGSRKVIKHRKRYFREEDVWLRVEIIRNYNECGKLIHMSKTRWKMKCFATDAKTVYNWNFERKCG